MGVAQAKNLWFTAREGGNRVTQESQDGPVFVFSFEGDFVVTVGSIATHVKGKILVHLMPSLFGTITHGEVFQYDKPSASTCYFNKSYTYALLQKNTNAD